ncbi:hypothetical protein [Planococcus donghaensis]|uniref:Uncharacterized protein n=1 Tax=Planococcus donghaensis TaxID=414778 RepID=A0A1C7EE70_9BACL|nr:hypothetical protein [Planococcus donghaensis]ANU22264.1 hypothetical protein BCM40_02415 [Planococcus donghaensis]
MAKNDFSEHANPKSSQSQRQGEEFKSIDEQAKDRGEKMREKGAHSNKGIGDENNPIGESQER